MQHILSASKRNYSGKIIASTYNYILEYAEMVVLTELEAIL